MTSPKLASETIYGRMYREPDTDPDDLPTFLESVAEGLLVPSVTNVIGVFSKPFLNTWYAKEAARAAVSAAQRFPGLIEQRPDTAGPWIQDAAPRIAAAAGALGDEVHDALDALAGGEEPENVSDDAQLFINGWHKFVADHSPTFLRREATCFGTVDGIDGPLGWAGTADFIAIINGFVVIGDYKTGRSIHTEATLQITALANADTILDEAGEELEPMPDIDGGVVVHLTRNGYYLRLVPLKAKNYETFSGLRRIWEFHQESLYSREPLGISAPIRNSADVTFDGRAAA